MSDLPHAERDWQAVDPFVHGDMRPAYEAWRDEFCSAYTAGARPATSAPGMA